MSGNITFHHFVKGVGASMVTKELRKLNRRELVDIIYQMKKNEQQMQEKIAALEEEVQEKRVRLATVGSIAEAAVSITNVFSEAQSAADLYLQEISAMKEETEKACAEKIRQAEETAAVILAESEKKYAALHPSARSETSGESDKDSRWKKWKLWNR